MPLIYGEGRKAFMRLQLEIIKKVDDVSIYAWTGEAGPSGLLATWPTAFAKSGNVVQINFPDDRIRGPPPAMTSLGLEFTTRYSRHDPHQEAIDEQHDVHTISYCLPTTDEMALVVYCSPCAQNSIPITQESKRQDYINGLVLRLKRFGATWQRVNCGQLEFTGHAMRDPEHMNAFCSLYIKQEGL